LHATKSVVVKNSTYILAYKSQNLQQNLDLKVGERLIRGLVFDRVEPRDSVLLCDVVPLGRGTHHHLLPVVHCQFTVAYLHGAL